MDLKKKTGTRYNEINEQHFSGSQASLFIGDIWVDDIAAIDYSIQHNQSPMYGYGSQHFDFVARGNMLITGSFRVNFREPNYLWLILERYKKFDTRLYTDRIASESKKYKEEKRRISLKESFIAETYEGDKRQRFNHFFNAENATEAEKNLLEQAREFNGLSEDNSKENFNHRAFNVLLGYGDNLGPDSPGETLESVHIVGKSKLINSDGRPIQEQYNFIARNLV